MSLLIRWPLALMSSTVMGSLSIVLAGLPDLGDPRHRNRHLT
ncbi:hypothetical protein CcrBL47_gp221 [Caulobacter phage BL47]|nr:hypothetical protein CcrBL47_gp221 [Caulobacter phage BL47]